MTKKIFSLLACAAFSAAATFAQAPYFNVFMGGTDFAPGTTNDISDAANFYTFQDDSDSETTNLWGANYRIDISGTGSALQSLQSINSSKWLAFGDSTYQDAQGETSLYAPYPNLVLAETLSAPQSPHFYFIYSQDATVTFGSANSEQESFSFSTNSFYNKGGGSTTFEIDPNAAQRNFTARFYEAHFDRSETVFGSVSRKNGYFDSFSATGNVSITNRGSLAVFAKRINVGGNFAADGTGILTIAVPDGTLDAREALISVEGEFQHLDKIVFDFANAEIGWGEYTLISAGSLGEGWSDIVSDDVEIRNLRLAAGNSAELEWSGGNSLMLTVNIPEPSAAALAAVAALLAAALGRRGRI